MLHIWIRSGCRVITTETEPLHRCATLPIHIAWYSGPMEKLANALWRLTTRKTKLGWVDPEKGIVIDPEVNCRWSFSDLKPECRSCRNVLRCMNMQCQKSLKLLMERQFASIENQNVCNQLTNAKRYVYSSSCVLQFESERAKHTIHCS